MRSRALGVGVSGALAGALFLLAFAAVAVWGLMTAWQDRVLRHAASPPAEEVPARTDAPALLDDPAFQPAHERPAYPNMVARPLFMSTRRVPEEAPSPVEPAVEEKPPPDPDPIQARLRSIVITADERFAWLQPQGEDRQIRLAPGGGIDGWTLTAVERTHVEFSFNDATMRLQLRPMRSVGDPSNPVRPRPQTRSPGQ